MISRLLAGMLVCASAGAALAAPLTFTVDMAIMHSFGQFDPAADLVVLRGTMNGWSGSADALADADGDLVFEIVKDLAPGTHAFKFVLVRGGSERWEHSIPDRMVTVGSEPASLPPVFFDHRAGWMPGGTRTGADLSFTPRLVSLGAQYRVGGEPVDLLGACADAGYGIVRLRLWHTPAEPWHGLDATVAFAREAKARGLDLMLDLHYSDTWADPGHQTKPAAWEGIPFEALVDSVYAYTNAVVRRFRDAGALPEYVQIGSEISAGMLWDDGRVGWAGSEWDTGEQWDRFAALVSAGVAGARGSLAPSERPAVVVHFDHGGNNAGCRWFFDNLLARGVAFDAIGLSYYPWWHGEIWRLRDNLVDLAVRYGREIMIVEAGYPWTLDWQDDTPNFVGSESQLHAGYPATPEGQLAFLRDVVTIAEATPGGLGTAVLYWEPGFLAVEGGPENPYENLTLFDFEGDALPGFRFGAR